MQGAGKRQVLILQLFVCTYKFGREHWRLECQLTQLRLEKAKQEGEEGGGEVSSMELEEVSKNWRMMISLLYLQS